MHLGVLGSTHPAKSSAAFAVLLPECLGRSTSVLALVPRRNQHAPIPSLHLESGPLGPSRFPVQRWLLRRSSCLGISFHAHVDTPARFVRLGPEFLASLCLCLASSPPLRPHIIFEYCVLYLCLSRHSPLLLITVFPCTVFWGPLRNPVC
jgi:hypothetical protein